MFRRSRFPPVLIDVTLDMTTFLHRTSPRNLRVGTWRIHAYTHKVVIFHGINDEKPWDFGGALFLDKPQVGL